MSLDSMEDDISQERDTAPPFRQSSAPRTAMPGRATQDFVTLSDIGSLDNYGDNVGDAVNLAPLPSFRRPILERSETWRTDCTYLTANEGDDHDDPAAEIGRLRDELNDLKAKHNIDLTLKDRVSETAKRVLEQEQMDQIKRIQDTYAEEIERRDSDFMKVQRDQAELSDDVARLKAALTGVTQTAKALRAADHTRGERGDDDMRATRSEVLELKSEWEERRAASTRELAEKGARLERDRFGREESLREKVDKLRAQLDEDVASRDAQIRKATSDATQLACDVAQLTTELAEVVERCNVAEGVAEFAAENSKRKISELIAQTKEKIQDMENSAKEAEDEANCEIADLMSNSEHACSVREGVNSGEEEALKENLTREMASLPEEHAEDFLKQRQEEERSRQELEERFTEKIEEMYQAHAEALARRGVDESASTSESFAELASLCEDFGEKARAAARRSRVKAEQDLAELKSHLQAQQEAAEIAAQEAASKAAALAAGIGVMNSSESVLQQLKSAEALGATSSERLCPSGCGYLVTWHATHCCNQCQLKKGKHGPRCSKLKAGGMNRSSSQGSFHDSPTRSHSTSSLQLETPARKSTSSFNATSTGRRSMI